ncbi:MAG: hypothetical protein PHE89_03160 [Alphaproteobacteria bacterium]|nr:hypothetical protein [Alphaproteobacteria bacterium]
MSDKKIKILIFSFCSLILAACHYNDFGNSDYEAMKLRTPNSVVVCRAKECAPAKLSMSNEYIFNSLTHLLTNNNRQKALICEANPANHICTENFITLPIRVGITPAYMYIDSVKLTDVSIVKGSPQVNLVLNYNVTYNGQTPECTSARTLLYVKNSDNIVMEDSPYSCKMTTIGSTTIKTLFLVDYIDLDYGYIGGYYSVGLSGPANGGGTGYMLLRLQKDAFPLAPALSKPKAQSTQKKIRSISENQTLDSLPTQTDSNVQIFPIKK